MGKTLEELELELARLSERTAAEIRAFEKHLETVRNAIVLPATLFAMAVAFVGYMKYGDIKDIAHDSGRAAALEAFSERQPAMLRQAGDQGPRIAGQETKSAGDVSGNALPPPAPGQAGEESPSRGGAGAYSPARPAESGGGNTGNGQKENSADKTGVPWQPDNDPVQKKLKKVAAPDVEYKDFLRKSPQGTAPDRPDAESDEPSTTDRNPPGGLSLSRERNFIDIPRSSER